MAAASIARGATTKPVIKKATKGAKKTSPSKASHPTYFQVICVQMIKDAILGLREKSGSSAHAIAKYMEEHHKADLPSNFKKILGQQLKNSVAKGKLIKVKASFKLSDAAKKEKSVKPAAEKKPKASKAAEKKTKPVEKADPAKKKASTVKPVKKGAVKKAPAKKTPVKLRTLKSIKTPSALKKAKKA